MKIYTQLVSNPSDINEHLPTLARYGERCSHITEFGVRNVVSTWAWLDAKVPVIECYDIEWPNSTNWQVALEYANSVALNLRLTVVDVLQTEIDETDLLFIDTWHTYNQLIQELKLHHNKVTKYIICHDTETYGKKTLIDNGLQQAILDFISMNSNWEIEDHYTNNNGLTILKRK